MDEAAPDWPGAWKLPGPAVRQKCSTLPVLPTFKYSNNYYFHSQG